MIQRLKENRILTLSLLIGLVAALILCGIRFGAELCNTKVAFCMPDEDIAILAEAHGMDFEQYKSILLDAGLTDGLSDEAAVWLVEDDVAYSHLPIDSFSPDYETPMVRAFRLRPEWGMRYASLGYKGYEEVENLTYRAITDRNIRVVQFTVFRESSTGKLISDPQEYVEVFEHLEARIARQGLTLGGEYSVFEPYSPSPVLLALTAFGVCASALLLLVLLFGLAKKLQYIMLALALPGSFAAFFLMERLAIQVFALATSVVFPCISLWYMARYLDLVSEKSLSRNITSYVGILGCSALISVIGGIFVSALQSSTFFLLAIENFRGVKLSQALPVVFAAFIVLRAFYGRDGIKGVLKEIKAGKNLIIILAALALAGGIIFFLLRTGDGLIDAGVLEQRFRNWLENVLLVRPRTKEFLISWPCISIALIMIVKGGRRYAWPFAILASTGFASIVNTFCHSRAPIWLSATRTVYGLIIGGFIGIILICLTRGVKLRNVDAH